jgi:hypothetical protein
MRLLLFVPGVLTAVGYVEKPAEAEQNHPWLAKAPAASSPPRLAKA